MNNRIFTMLMLIGIATIAQAQKEQTLGSVSHTRGGFGGFYLISSQAAGNSGGGAGVDGAFIINDFFFGGFLQAEGYGQRQVGNRKYTLSTASTGVWMGYAFPSFKVVHVYTSLKFGPGIGALTRQDNDPTNDNDYNDTFLIIAPEAGAEVNIAHWCRLALTLGYRWANDVEGLPGLNRTSFNRPFFGLSARFGSFGYK